jgi:predicted O-linked N-acetylglucosamine transferase (SPINDLY family)
LHQVGLLDEALVAFDRAISLRPENLDASLNRAALLQMMGRDFDAVQGLLHALTFKPDDTKLLCNVAVGLTTLEQHALALPYFHRLMQIDSSYDYAAGYRFFSELHVCDWTHFDEHYTEVVNGVAEGRRAINPLAFCAINDDPALQLRCAQLFAQHRYAVPKVPLWQGQQYRHRKLRLGYLSPDFREHPVGHLTVGVIENHDKSRVESFGFSMGMNDASTLRKRFKVGFDHFFECSGKTSADIAQFIRAAEIDVLVDLAGFTAGSRAEIFAMRPAPIHVNYLGYPSTMGAPWMDYIVADDIVIPQHLASFYQERVLRLPFCYLPIDDSLQVAPNRPRRSEVGLPDDGLVFCSFNHDYKINPKVWQVWMDLLHQQPSSVLWLMKLNEHATHNLRTAAKRADVDPSRIIFASRTPRIEDHLARYQLADVFLDTNPYNAHSTATDALRSGLPIVTLPGQTFASRVAASVIKHTHANHCRIASSAKEYGQLAATVAMASDRFRRTQSTDPCQAAFPSSVEMARALEDLFIGLESHHLNRHP